MEISGLTIKLIIILTPGALATTIYQRLTVHHKPQTDFMFVIISILQGMFAYLILQVICSGFIFLNNFSSLTNKKYELLRTFSNISDSNLIPYSEVIYASLISIILGFITTKVTTSKLVYWIANKLNVSNKYGEENLFSHFLNSTDISWVYVRDIPNSLTYLGSVRMFSETQDFKEIVLDQVTVYTYPESKELYEVDNIYLCIPKDLAIIEKAKLK